MKIAYIYYVLSEHQIGIETKVRQQAVAAERAGLNELDLFLLNPTKDDRFGQGRMVRWKTTHAPLSYLEHFFRRYRFIERRINLEPYDYIILRYPLADKSGVGFANRYQVITEHHADERAELESRMAASPSHLETQARRLILSLERRHAVPMLKRCRGIIAVTDEIRAVEQALAGPSVPAITTGNGIDVASVPHTRFARFDGRMLDLLFIGTSNRPWHGLDRIITSLKRYQGSVEITLHVVGSISPSELGVPLADLEHVRFHGPLFGDKLDALVSRMNLAISTMGLFRKRLAQASSLKTREYTARGIPFILAYHDPDLQDVDPGRQFFLNFENDDSLLDFEEILAFATSTSARSEEMSNYMRAYAMVHMDWQVKLKAYMAFVNRIDAVLQESRQVRTSG